MELLRSKARIAALWIIQVVFFSASLTPAEMESSASAAGQGGIAQSPASVDRIVVAVCFFVPCLMPWLSMTLMDVA